MILILVLIFVGEFFLELLDEVLFDFIIILFCGGK